MSPLAGVGLSLCVLQLGLVLLAGLVTADAEDFVCGVADLHVDGTDHIKPFTCDNVADNLAGPPQVQSPNQNITSDKFPWIGILTSSTSNQKSCLGVIVSQDLVIASKPCEANSSYTFEISHLNFKSDLSEVPPKPGVNSENEMLVFKLVTNLPSHIYRPACVPDQHFVAKAVKATDSCREKTNTLLKVSLKDGNIISSYSSILTDTECAHNILDNENSDCWRDFDQSQFNCMTIDQTTQIQKKYTYKNYEDYTCHRGILQAAEKCDLDGIIGEAKCVGIDENTCIGFLPSNDKKELHECRKEVSKYTKCIRDQFYEITKDYSDYPFQGVNCLHSYLPKRPECAKHKIKQGFHSLGLKRGYNPKTAYKNEIKKKCSKMSWKDKQNCKNKIKKDYDFMNYKPYQGKWSISMLKEVKEVNTCIVNATGCNVCGNSGGSVCIDQQVDSGETEFVFWYESCRDRWFFLGPSTIQQRKKICSQTQMTEMPFLEENTRLIREYAREHSETNITILPLYPKPVIVMLGNTGVGKSTLANGLLMGHAGKKQCFKTSSGASSQTKLTKWSTGKWLGVGHCVTVIDTPGTQDTGGKQRDYENVMNIMNLLKDEIGQIDVFLVLFNGKQPRFGQGIKAALNTYEAIFGHTFWDHVVTEFTFWKFVKSDIRDRYVENCRELKNDCLNDSELCADDVCEWDSSDDGDSSGDGDYSGDGNNSGDNSGDGDYYEGRRKRSVNNQNPYCKLMMEDEGSFSSNTSPENIINSNGSAVNEDFWDAQCGWRSLPQETDYPAGWDEGSKAIYNKADLIGRYVKAESWKRQYEEKMFVSKQIPSVFINPLWSNNKLVCERFQRETNKLWNTIESFDPYSCTDKCEAPESYFVGKPHIFGEDTIYIEKSETTPGSPLHCSVWNGIEGAAISMDVEWYHSSNKPLNLSTGLYSMNILRGGGTKKQQTLQLNINTANITLQDQGLYYCFLENHTLSNKPSIELGSLVTPDMIQRGDNITASCEIFDIFEEQMKEKLPYVKWYFAKKLQDAGSNYNMTLDSEAKHDQFSIQKLIFERMAEDYEGNYTCKVGGQFSDEVNVNMNVDASWSEWGSETPCSVTCGNGGHKTRTRSCNMQRKKGLSCDTLKETALKDGNHADTKQTSCEYKCCPVDGLWSKWQSWNSCSQKCFNTTNPHAQQGQKNRQRTCNNPSKQCNGKDCVGSSIENSSCNTFNCKIHGEWSTWSNWSKCTRDLNVACSGREERTRQCTNPAPQYGGMKCSDSGVQTRNCDPVCAVDCKETSWLNWSPCSKTCQHYKSSEHGTSTRKRGSIPPVNGGKTCDQLGIRLQEEKSCITNLNCPRDGFWGAWSNYGKCDNGTGEKRRERSCYFEDTLNSPANMQEIFDQTKSFGGHDCPGIPEEVTKCSVDCRCTAPWSKWETCSAKCKGPADKLIQRRRRSCIPAKNNGRECTDDDTTQEEDCKVPRCPYEIDGVWSEWGAFSECPYECGGSFQTKKRTCDHPNKDLLDYDPKKDILKDCAGSSIAVHEEMCNPQACSIKSLTFVMDTSGSFDGTDQDTAQQLASALMNELARENIVVPLYQVISSPGRPDDYYNPGSFLRYSKPEQVLPATSLTATFINQYTNGLKRNQYGTQCNLDTLYFTLEHHAKNGAVIVLYTDDGTYEPDRKKVAKKITDKVTDKQATIVIFITPHYIGDDESMVLYRNIAENRVYVMSEIQNTAENVIGIVKRNLQKKGDGNRCIAAGGPLWPIEQYECQFPFKYEGVKYFDCIETDHVQPWCSTFVDKDLNHLDGNVGLCGDCSGVIEPACSGYTVLKVSNIKDQERGDTATTSIMTSNSSSSTDVITKPSTTTPTTIGSSLVTESPNVMDEYFYIVNVPTSSVLDVSKEGNVIMATKTSTRLTQQWRYQSGIFINRQSGLALHLQQQTCCTLTLTTITTEGLSTWRFFKNYITNVETNRPLETDGLFVSLGFAQSRSLTNQIWGLRSVKYEEILKNSEQHKCLELFEKEEDAKSFPSFDYHSEYPGCWENIQPKFKLFTKTKSKNCIIADSKTELFDLKSCLALDELKAMVNLRKIVFLIHGFRGTSEAGEWTEDMADLIIEHEKNKDVAVITVDWRKGAAIDWGTRHIVYGQAAANTRYVGIATARIIHQLRILKPKAKIHCIGHSLGAHTCGFVGKEIAIDRISGMDPAGPLFHIAKPEERLDKTDATNVDVLHTDGDTFGLMKPIGDIDFYAGKGDDYYGSDQKGCGLVIDISVVCDHSRSYEIYRATIVDGSCTPGVKCLGYNKQGYGYETLTECEDWKKEPRYGYWDDGGFTGLYGFIAEKETPYCDHYQADSGFERCVNSWCLQHGTNQQYIRCKETKDGGDTCVEPEIKYGQTEGGIPHVHSDNDYDTWCEQIFQREKMGSITSGPRDCSAPKGKLFWCSSFDQSRPKWCDWSDGNWRSSSLDQTSGCSSAITSLTCRAWSGYYRFESPAGIKLPESGNDVRENEAWIHGGHPKVNDKVQRRRICFGPQCEHAKQIRVITCPSNRGESFHLYELEKPPKGYKYVAQEGTCPTDWVSIRTNCFFVSSDKLSWADAKNSCKAKGGELFEPQNVNTNEKVWKYVKLAEKLDVHTHYWVGFNDMVKEGDWLSAITGDFNALSEFPWSPNSPHNNNTLNCINVITKSGKWTDSSCSTPRNYICQRDQNV